MNPRFFVRLILFEDDMNGAMLGLLETLDVAGCIVLHRSDIEGGACLDLPARDPEMAERICANLRAWHMRAEVIREEEGSR